MHTISRVRAFPILLASVAAVASAQAGAVTSSADEIKLTLDSIPSLNIDDTTSALAANSLGELYRSKELRKKGPIYLMDRAFHDIPSGSMRLQYLRFQSISTGTLLPLLNPELKKK